MRVLFSSSSGVGHVQPVLPLAIAMRDRGHDVVWATAEDGCEWVRSAGVDTHVAGTAMGERMAQFAQRWPDVAAMRGEERAEKMFPLLFGAVTARAAFAELLELANQWRPDLIVSEAGDFAAPVVGAAIGVPQVTHGFGLVVPPERVALAGEMAADLWSQVGLSPRPFGGQYDHLYIDIYPPSMQPDDLSYMGRIQRRRPLSHTGDAGTIAADVQRVLDGGRPLVYVTFGTLFNVTPAFSAAVAAFDEIRDVDALVTVGTTGDAGAFGRVPDHVVVERYVPQAAVFDRCAAVVSHAGSGTLLGALAHGIPQVCVPQAADQFRNAQATEAAGAGRAVLPGDVTAAAIAHALREVLDDATYRVDAARVAKEIEAMPAVDEVVDALEALVR
ncbi:MAG TPA: glycosyltransferase [Acidimicrobiales bacterium]|jgi:UDP:flavonoid glycosyltransferase YjiC (YdhE family)|nr:glycosyltransferase [Acidimicrobiales bacterium]